MRPRSLSVALPILIALVWPRAPRCAERYADVIRGIPGMPGAISDVAQDEDGFLWVSSEEGLFRFDGTEFLRRGDRVGFHEVAVGPEGHVVAGKQDAVWREWDGERFEPIVGPDGAPIPDVQIAAFDRDGALWLVARSEVLRRDGAGRFTRGPLPPGEIGRSVVADPEGGVLVGTRGGTILRMAVPESARVVVEGLGGLVTHLALDGTGRVVANVRWGPNTGVVRLTEGHVERLAVCGDRPTGLAVRGETIWSSWDTGVLVVPPGGPAERLDPRDGFEGGGHVRVDREGALWTTSLAGGLTVFPEPDTRVYTERAGLERGLVRGVVRAGPALWAATWGGVLRYVAEEDRWVEAPTGRYLVRGPLCPLETGEVLALGVDVAAKGAPERGALVRLDGRGAVPLGEPVIPPPAFSCAPRGDAGLWLAIGDRLLSTTPDGAIARTFALAQMASPIRDLVAAPGGSLWAATEAGALCRTDDPGAGWTCWRPEGMGDPVALAPIDTERAWVATNGAGVLACDRTACRAVLGGDVLGTSEVVGLERSARGGIWVLSRTSALRIDERAAEPSILERVSRWHGVPPWWLSSMIEDVDGSLWITGLAGIARLPAGAREALPPPPVVRPVRLTVGGRERPLDGTAIATSGTDTVELRWAALSFRDPASLRFAFRLDPESAWTEAPSPNLFMVAPRAGLYRVETAAALGAGSWSPAATAVDLRVVPPWYLRPAFVGAIAFVFAGIGAAGYRLRVAHLLRLERQRTQIAMDLHDDLGATLGGIGLLATIADDETLDPGERRKILSRIARQTGSAGQSLSDIVWSLRPGTGTLDQLALALRERAFELVPAEGIDLGFEFPERLPRLPLPLPVRRNALWIAVEAVRNAVRHGEARRITVRLEPAGDSWRLDVEDDGRGRGDDDAVSARGGLGLESMRRRAEAMRAELEIGSAGSGGTRVTLTFRTDGRRPRTIV